jgi:hypothetical protein
MRDGATWKEMEACVFAGMKMKERMLKKGLSVDSGKCSKCDGRVHGKLVGKKQVIHFWCDGPCKREMME